MFATILEAVGDKEWKKKYSSCGSIKLGKIPKDTSKGSKEQDMLAVVDIVANGYLYVHESMYDLIDEMVKYPHSLTCDMYDMVAKLNKLFWTARPIQEEGKQFSKYNKQITQNRCEITGY